MPTTQKLKTETYTIAMCRQVLTAAAKVLQIKKAALQADFEHGQWWISQLGTGAQWSVVDAEGGRSYDGFDFEQVTQGDED